MKKRLRKKLTLRCKPHHWVSIALSALNYRGHPALLSGVPTWKSKDATFTVTKDGLNAIATPKRGRKTMAITVYANVDLL